MRCGPTAGTALRTVATLVVTTVAALVGLSIGPVRAAPASAATDCVGVVVDARQIGGTLRTGCALGDPRDGFAALTKAGFRYTLRARDGLLCQLDQQPASCTDTTGTTYWSYWYRAPGSRTWVYANEGPGTHDPKPRSTEAWVWQDGGKKPPPDLGLAAICPQAASPAPRPSGAPTTEPAPGPSRTQDAATRAASAPAARPSRTATTTAAPRSATAATRETAPVPTSSAAGPTTAVPAATAPDSSTSPVTAADSAASGSSLPGTAGAAVGGLVAAGIGLAAYLRSRRGGP
ncbi:MAG: hypothetical protein QOI54_459 [Actinomycetota bacterium]|nr:hypothetical protein [Actinomycetota bacterium]